MQNFDFYNPTRICFGEGQIAKLADLVPQDAKVLILLGGSSARRNGTLEEVKQALGERPQFEFDGIEPNPTYETLMKAVAFIKENDVDFLLAVGGGSVIDGTKFVAAAAHYDGEPWEILQTFGAKVMSAMPFGSVLTLPATGSEMNSGSVVTRKSLKAKLPFMSPHVFPQFSVLDPVKTYTLPKRQIANGVVDAFVHTTEQYLTYPVGAMVQDRYAESLLKTLIEVGPKALATPEDYNVRANLMWTATCALNGVIGAGVPHDWATHMIGHELTALHDIDHARTLAIVLPSLLRHTKAEKKAKLLQYAERVWDITEGDDDARIDAAIEKTQAFFESLEIGTHLSDYELDESHLDALVDQLETHGMVALGEHQKIDLDASRAILKGAL
ncbi:iron-containing alcohol dehydrogenase [Parashewanella curva]|uniref:Iron-containing alcohol dehydrogenase n=1 Tax=Parashewanella curva TaxID=2338552 RepID=A0A3L8Q121_9GAMM|nr:iron-containing alcohol dehydrogenase [Parashewanella curva]RLV60759.1 iron-containing alcohol dehydrogenase [Parashewanella curva]